MPSLLPENRETPTRVLVCGDWHGNARWAELCVEYAERNHCQAIIQVGDFGFWTPGLASDMYLRDVEKAAREAEIPIYWLDGNHEDHSRAAQFNDPQNRPWTTYMQRGYRWTWNDKRYMAVGGAYSIDRFMRQEGRSYWDEELLDREQVIYASRDDGIPVDIAFTHDCPRGVSIPGIGPDSKPRGGESMWPPDMLAGAQAHRILVREIWEATHPKLWIHGHYHVPYEAWYGPTRFIGLDMDATTLSQSTMVLDI